MKQTRPVITEKSMTLARNGWYSFAVAAFSRKENIAKEISDLYNVTVKEVRTIRRKGKMHRTGRKMIMKQRADWKKAMVRLAKGQKIAIFDIGEETAK
ncbi:50S ribosomal protein L23 [Patescibacteria group bacterium]|nr:50S ribosomal protein L23 [Patescibacteria group bacterium]